MDAFPLLNPRSYMTLGMNVLLLLIKSQLVFYRKWDMLMLINIKWEPSILVNRSKHFNHNRIQLPELWYHLNTSPGPRFLCHDRC